MAYRLLVVLLSSILMVSGCGYTTSSLLPTNFKSIYVNNFANKINITAEQSNLRMYRGYRPGIETDVTKAVINRYIFDGNLKVFSKEDADLELTGELVDFRREPLRYDANDNVEEYRVKFIVDMELKDVKSGKIVWSEKGFSGETTYRTSGSLAKGEDAAINDAVSDLARRIVERTVEGW